MNKSIIDEIHQTRESLWESAQENIDNFIKMITESENKHKNRLISKIVNKSEANDKILST